MFVKLLGITVKNGIDDFMQQLATLVNLYVLDHRTTWCSYLHQLQECRLFCGFSVCLVLYWLVKN